MLAQQVYQTDQNEITSEQINQTKNEILITLNKINKKIANNIESKEIDQNLNQEFLTKYRKILTYSDKTNDQNLKEEAKSYLFSLIKLREIAKVENIFYKVDMASKNLKYPMFKEFVANLFTSEHNDFETLTILFKDIEIGEKILNTGIDPNFKEKESNSTILMNLVIKHENESIKLLLKYKADIDLVDKDGNSPLIAAIVKGHDDTAEMLINKGANVNKFDNYNNNNALLWAAANGNNKLVKILIDKVDNLNHINKSGVNALILAAANDHHEIVKILINKTPINQFDKNRRTALIWAAGNGNNKIIKTLIKNEADLNHIDIHQRNALMWAAANNNYETVKILLKNDKIKINDTDKNKDNALTLAMENNNYKIAEILIKNKINIDCFDINGFTPLMNSINNNEEEKIKFLIENGANLDLANEEGVTAKSILKKNPNLQIILEDKTKSSTFDSNNKINQPISNEIYSTLTINSNIFLKPAYSKLSKEKKIQKNNNLKKISHHELKNSNSNSSKQPETEKLQIKAKNQKIKNIQQPEIKNIEKWKKIINKAEIKAQQHDLLKKLKQEEKLIKQKEMQEKAILEIDTSTSNLTDSEKINNQIKLTKETRNELAQEIKPYTYKIKRNTELDHEDGRPGIIIAKKNQKALVFLGSSTKKENSLTILLGEKETFFNEITWIDENKIIGNWSTNPTLTEEKRNKIADQVPIENLKKIYPKKFQEENKKETSNALFDDPQPGTSTGIHNNDHEAGKSFLIAPKLQKKETTIINEQEKKKEDSKKIAEAKKQIETLEIENQELKKQKEELTQKFIKEQKEQEEKNKKEEEEEKNKNKRKLNHTA